MSQTDKQLARNPKFVWQTAFEASGLHTSAAGFIGYVMSNRDNGDGKGFYMSAKTLAESTGFSERTAERAIAQLMETKWIKQTRRGGRRGGVNEASRFMLNIPNPTPVTGWGDSESDSQPDTGDGLERSQPDTGDAQPDTGDPQPDTGDPQPDTGDGLVDQITTPDKRRDKQAEAGTSEEEIQALLENPPPFDDEPPTQQDTAAIEAELRAKTQPKIANDPLRPPPLRMSTLPEWKQRDLYDRDLAEIDGLDASGDPIQPSGRPGYISRR